MGALRYYSQRANITWREKRLTSVIYYSHCVNAHVQCDKGANTYHSINRARWANHVQFDTKVPASTAIFL